MKRLAFGFLFLASAAFGTTLLAVDLPALSRGAEVIVVGTVRATAPRLTLDGRRIITDTEIEVEPGQITVQKQRDLDKSFSTAFELDVVTLGTDEDGDPVTSCTVNLLSSVKQAAPGVATPKEREVLEGLEACADTAVDPRAGVPQSDLVKFFDKPEMNPENVRKSLRGLKQKNLVERVSRGRWRTTCPNGADVNTWFAIEKSENLPDRSGGTPLEGNVFD